MTTRTIKLSLLLKWLDEALDAYDTGNENNPASRVVDYIHVHILTQIYGDSFDPDYMFNNVDAAIDRLKGKA